MRVDATPGRRVTHARATWAGGRSNWRATSLSASTMPQLRSVKSLRNPGLPEEEMEGRGLEG
ncbi:hypothetical protein [Cystobacter fuscus]|uniref:hypothetical protein n=1 Tax=Cystobacter fuscus TaxID=43 RepID=UPI0037C05E66